jgi:phosphoglycerate dehydrogenase-like enzyme
MTVKILVPFKVSPEIKNELEETIRGFDASLVTMPELEEQAARDQFLMKQLADTEVIVSGYLTPEQLAAAKQLKWVHVHFAGVNRLLSVPELVQSEIIVTNAAGVSSKAIADQVIGYLITFSRALVPQIQAQQRKEWAWSYQRLRQIELDGQTLGIVGYGNIGGELAKRAKGFGMRVIATKNDTAGNFPHVDEMLHSGELNILLAESDYVVICAPLTPETQGLIGRSQFEQMKPSAYFINIARGQLVKENEMIEILREKRIAGAALDVFEVEPLPADSPLWELDNVLITPHSTGHFEHFMERTMSFFADQLRRYLSGQPLVNQVDKKRGY